jgi:hypothetical protein
MYNYIYNKHAGSALPLFSLHSFTKNPGENYLKAAGLANDGFQQ